MNPNQQAFLDEYIRTGDKIAAYRKAYPSAKESSLKNAANRLLKNLPEIQEAVSRKRKRIGRKAEKDAYRQMKFEYLTKLRMKQLLTMTAEGTRELEKVWHTRNGFVTHDVKPTHAQSLSAMRQYALLEGWYVQGRAKKQKEKEEKKKEEPQDIELYMEGLPWDEYFDKWGGTIDAYFEPEQTSRCQPDDNNSTEHFLRCQKYRDEKKDKERDEKMTPELQVEENRAMAEWKQRPVDDSLYRPEKKVITELWDKYLETKDDEILKEYKAVQKLAGLRFLKHRHRYEAEREAGWEFHPFNNAVIRKRNSEEQITNSNINNGHCGPDPQPSDSLKGNAQHNTNGNTGKNSVNSDNSINSGSDNNPQDVRLLRPHLHSQMLPRNDLEKRQQTTTNQGQEVKSNNPARAGTTNNPGNPTNPVNRGSDYKGYTYIHDVVQDHWDAYLAKQAHQTRRPYENVVKLSKNRGAPAEIRARIEQETGWEYHPDDPSWVRRIKNWQLPPGYTPEPLKWGNL